MTTNLARGGIETFGQRLLLISLGVLFGASMIGYGVTRARLGGEVSVTVPGLLWVSTAVLLLAGGVLEMAARRLRNHQGRGYRGLVTLALVLSAVFLAVQIPALAELLQEHLALRDQGNPLLGFVFFLILLHALHVVAGIVALALLVRRAWRGREPLDHEYPGIRHTARYWHFLDLVWVVMFAAFLLG